MERKGLSGERNRRFVRIDRQHSATDDLGSMRAATAADSPFFAPVILGKIPKKVRPSRLSISSWEVILESACSAIKTVRALARSPRIRPKRAFKLRLGRSGFSDGLARSRIRTLLIRFKPDSPASLSRLRTMS